MKTTTNMSRRSAVKLLAAGAASTALTGFEASAQSRGETLRHVMGGTINSLDATAPGSTREVFGISMNVYDRLASFGRKQVDDYWTFDFDNIRGELAERVERSADGRTLTFHLRQGAKWHDGSPVTAADVKWSLDRAVISKTLSPAQLASGSLTKADQFRIASDNVVEVMLDKPDRLALANLCVPFSPMINSTLAKKNATEEDPWAVNWLKENAAAGGAYTVEQHRAGQQTILRRNEAWQNGAGGKLPFFQRVIAQTVPEAATRANLVERGDADLAIDLQASDISALEQRKKVKVLAIPQTNGFTALVFNVRQAPFNNAKVRAAIAAAIPYENLFKAALFERGRVLYGASWTEAPNGDFPQPLPERFDLDKAKSLLAEAGMASGFATTFSYPAGAAAFGEPMAALIKESLGRIGIDVSIQKMPDAQYTTMEVERRLAISLGTGTAWLPAPDYFMRTYFAFEQRWNFSGMRDPELEALVQDARFETDAAKYQATSRKMIDIVAREMPMVMLWQPNQDAVMMPQVQGFTYAFHRQADYRDLSRA